jgi:hypothetical protein
MRRDAPVTAVRIAEITKQSQSRIHRMLRKLPDPHLIERTEILNKQARGRACDWPSTHEENRTADRSDLETDTRPQGERMTPRSGRFGDGASAINQV